MSKVAKDQQNQGENRVKYQVHNWARYNAALVNRGDITLYFSEEVLNAWYSDEPPQRGAQVVYSDLCIETLLTLKVVFKLAYRQTQGFARSLLRLMQIQDLSVPSYTQICRRAATLEVAPYEIPPRGSIVIAIDSTGIKVYGEGEWKVRQHGYIKRRTWRKLHLGVDPDSGFIHCHSLTLNNVGDASQVEALLDQVEAPIEAACLDGAYDTRDTWDELQDRGIEPVIPPRENAVEWYCEVPDDRVDYARNVALRRIQRVGRKQWKQEVGYHRRSLSETAMFRYKTIHGNRFYSRKFNQQQTENDLKIKTLNLMTAQGMPIAKPKMTA